MVAKLPVTLYTFLFFFVAFPVAPCRKFRSSSIQEIGSLRPIVDAYVHSQQLALPTTEHVNEIAALPRP